ncbi:hypothetical protein [Streptomyces sp. NPDC006335]|uniref:hypothetical protein n=1 Tax=Streptomyces sp. NPDC006335 TaxID=3156895 RepID=UPI0033BAC50F
MTFAIHDLWQTPVFTGSLSTDDIPHLIDITSAHATSRNQRAQQLAQALTTAAPLLVPTQDNAPEPSWHWITEQWKPGYHAGLRYSPGNVHAIVVLNASGTPRHPESGQISLHDPRVGANKVFLPGLPWGRHHHLLPRPGNVLVFPSWLGWSVAPVQDGHTIDVCLLHTDVTAPRANESLQGTRA